LILPKEFGTPKQQMFHRRSALARGAPWKPSEEKLLAKMARHTVPREDALNELSKTRSLAAIRSKLRKVRIGQDLFGDTYRSDKDAFTVRLSNALQPKTVFEAYAGCGHQTLKWLTKARTVLAAERNKTKASQLRGNLKREGYRKAAATLTNWETFKKGNRKVFLFTGDAVNAAVSLAAREIRIDLVDLDTCGSTVPTVPLFLRLLKPRALVITHGEFHSLRFSRRDVLSRLLPYEGGKRVRTSAHLADALERTIQFDALRTGNEIKEAFWLEKSEEVWLGAKNQGMLRRCYKVKRPRAAADCLNALNLTP
jgi:hypothetical protein